MANTNNNLINFISLSESKYQQLKTGQQVYDNNLYFISDGARIYKGTQDVTQSIFFVSNANVPTTTNISQKNRIYIAETSTDSGIFSVTVCNNSGAPTLICPGYIDSSFITNNNVVNVVGTLIDNQGNNINTYDNQLATLGVIKAYIQYFINAIGNPITDVSYNYEDGEISVTSLSGTEETFELTGVAHDIEYDSDNLTITIPMYGNGTDYVINLPKANFIRDAKYLDKDTTSYGTNGADYKAAAAQTELHNYTPGELRYKVDHDVATQQYAGQGVIVFIVYKDITNGIEESLVIIPAEDLITDYVAGTDPNADVNVNINNHTINAKVRIASDGNNILEDKTESGQATLIADRTKILTNVATDIANDQDIITDGQVIITDGTSGNIKHSLHTLGGATLSKTTINNTTTFDDQDGTILATEAAVVDAIEAAIDDLDEDVAHKVGGGVAALSSEYVIVVDTLNHNADNKHDIKYAQKVLGGDNTDLQTGTPQNNSTNTNFSGTANTLSTETTVAMALNALDTRAAHRMSTSSGSTNNVVTKDSKGDIQDSGKAIGTSTLTATVNGSNITYSSNTLATEAAVAAALTWTVIPDNNS